ncbi:bifunctional 2-polyprenyl-6-hydroxyphenol methylase/3-demethylubiquinol 3-O-methyltransferase UbiG [Azospirillum sp. TSH100]|uniref:class I SAM-dependent methyltransferase n=1 Tax=Azospirillum sp. TSH100 TaxID=652764 RepID=UPI001304A82B|nr:class I SAM-dependent methyltransferase [Azospirillum sp. TSH100]
MTDVTPARTVEFDFTHADLTELVAGCAADPLATIVRQRIVPGSHVLEAGAGSGKWLKALADQGFTVDGIEINNANVERFRAAWPDIPFIHGDVERMPYGDAAFDAILSLGVVEHLIDGPERALAEMHRVLKPGGTMFLTVPDANASFRLEQVKDHILHRLYGSEALRRLLGKRPAAYSRDAERQRLKAIGRRRRAGVPVKFSFAPDQGRSFYEYRFTTARIVGAIEAAGFQTTAIDRLYPADRLYQIFGRLAGSAGTNRPISLNPLGRLLLTCLPRHWIDHMILVVAQRPELRPELRPDRHHG